jgi:EmrB/QacA subfamily drug resistance transporter
LRPALLVPLIVACALFMEHVDATVIATSLPVIARDLGVAPIVLKLGLTSYLVSLAVFIPVSGWLTDRIGGRVVFCSAIAIFMVSSMLCGVARSFAFFVAARFLQGVGGAMMVPVGRIVIVRTVSRDELVTALNYLTVPALLGPLCGPPLGGFITTYWHWRWIFFINVPISILGIFLALHFMENVRESEVPPLDTSGFVLSAIGLSVLMFGLSAITEDVVPRMLAAACIVFGGMVTYVYFRMARRKQRPLLEFDLFKVPTFWVGVGGGSLFRIGIGAMALLLPLMLQLGFGLTPLQSGMLTCASAVGALFIKSLIKLLLRLYGFRRLLLVNSVFASATVAAIGLFTAHTAHWLIFTVLVITGCFRSLQFTALNAITYAEIPDHRVSAATSMFATVQQLSLGVGVTVGAFALQASNFIQGHPKIVAADFWPAFLVLGLIAMSSAYSASKLSPDAGEDMAGRQPKPELETAEMSRSAE